MKGFREGKIGIPYNYAGRKTIIKYCDTSFMTGAVDRHLMSQFSSRFCGTCLKTSLHKGLLHVLFQYISTKKIKISSNQIRFSKLGFKYGRDKKEQFRIRF